MEIGMKDTRITACIGPGLSAIARAGQADAAGYYLIRVTGANRQELIVPPLGGRVLNEDVRVLRCALGVVVDACPRATAVGRFEDLAGDGGPRRILLKYRIEYRRVGRGNLHRDPSNRF